MFIRLRSTTCTRLARHIQLNTHVLSLLSPCHCRSQELLTVHLHAQYNDCMTEKSPNICKWHEFIAAAAIILNVVADDCRLVEVLASVQAPLELLVGQGIQDACHLALYFVVVVVLCKGQDLGSFWVQSPQSLQQAAWHDRTTCNIGPWSTCEVLAHTCPQIYCCNLEMEANLHAPIGNSTFPDTLMACMACVCLTPQCFCSSLHHDDQSAFA